MEALTWVASGIMCKFDFMPPKEAAEDRKFESSLILESTRRAQTVVD
jgi:hypothetical protein